MWKELSITLPSKVLKCLSLAILLCSCAAQKALPVESQKDSVTVVIKESVVYKDSIIYVEVPVEVDKAILPDSDTSRIETSLAVSEAWVTRGQLNHTIRNKPAARLSKVVNIPTYLKEENIEKVEEKIIVQEIEVEKPLNSWQTFRMMLGTIALIIVAIWAVLKIVKKWIIKT